MRLGPKLTPQTLADHAQRSRERWRPANVAAEPKRCEAVARYQDRRCELEAGHRSLHRFGWVSFLEVRR